MKKLIAFLTLIGLVVMAVLIPQMIRDAKQTYEERMLAVISAIKTRVQANPTIGRLSVGVYAPVIQSRKSDTILLVKGVIHLQIAGGQDHLDRFEAEIKNDCGSSYDPKCLRVKILLVKGAELVQAGEIATLLSTLPRRPLPPSPDVALDNGPASTFPPGTKQAKPAESSAPKPKAEATAEPAEPIAVSKDQNKQEKVPQKSAEKVAEQPTETGAAGELKPTGPAVKKAENTKTEPAAVPEPPAAVTEPPAAALEPPVETAKPAEEKPSTGGPELAVRFPVRKTAPSAPSPITESDDRVLRIQRALRRFGYDPGRADNVVGRKTTAAILAYQRQYGLEPTGEASTDFLKHILSQPLPQQHARADASPQPIARAGEDAETASFAPAGPLGQVAQIQAALRTFGYDPGQVDNVVGRKTRSAILAYQRRNGLEPTGEPSLDLLNHIRGISTRSDSR